MRRWGRAVRALTATLTLIVVGSALAEDSPQNTLPAATPVAKPGFWEAEIWTDPERGFLFYQPDAEVPKKRLAPPAEKARPAPHARRLQDIKDHDELKAERERRLKIAIMDPSEENMRAYLEANKFFLAKSAMFADMWRRTTWANPTLDFNARNPNANFAQTSIRLERNAQKEDVVRELGQRKYGVLFFARSDCPYCKLQAPVLAELQRKFGVEVMAISVDKRPIEGFPGARADNGISFRVTGGHGISVFPSMYLVSSDRPEAVMLGSGVLALDEMIERINVLTQYRPGADIFGGID
jgi:conjugal transfer pilus assembly protein TraF